MLVKSRKHHNGLITLHKPVPPCLLHETTSRDVGKEVVESPCVRSVSQKSTKVIKDPGIKKVHTVPSCSVKQQQDKLLVEKQEADAITKPLLDNENGFVKDLEGFLKHRDMQHVRKHELLHKRWTDRVWWPVQRSIERHFIRRRHEGSKKRHSGDIVYSAKVNTAPLEDPLFLHSRSRTREKKAVLHCLTGSTDSSPWVTSEEEQSRNKRSSRNQSLICMTVSDGRCFRPECWSSIDLSRRCSAKSWDDGASSTSSSTDMGTFFFLSG
ncbi:protein FAM228A isoform X2 [Silurus meridionalis]|uniref:protein FAM228A isoform X2 n=1 Tax=Silurus meridionalis TaxID=175797 RepID=UPI001EEB2FC6|nr:protein FAM228A isoform X2 [Silurus meridionalis]